jgi:hypothetical protein
MTFARGSPESQKKPEAEAGDLEASGIGAPVMIDDIRRAGCSGKHAFQRVSRRLKMSQFSKDKPTGFFS